jgi:Ca2+-binding RTX toxin-like protein
MGQVTIHNEDALIAGAYSLAAYGFDASGGGQLLLATDFDWNGFSLRSSPPVGPTFSWPAQYSFWSLNQPAAALRGFPYNGPGTLQTFFTGVVEEVDGSTFDAISVDLNMLPTWAMNVTFVGTKTDATTVSQTFTTSSTLQTYTFNGSFTDLISLTFTPQATGGPVFGVYFDNFVLDDLTLPPDDILLSNDNVPGDSAIDTVVGAFSATDPDSSPPFTFSLLDDAAGLFALDDADLVVAGAFDVMVAQIHDVTVRAADDRGNFRDETFAIKVGHVVPGGAGDDPLSGAGEGDIIEGFAGNDTLAGAAGYDILDGGAGTDTADYSGAAGPVTVNLSLAGSQLVSATQGSDTLIDIENIVGSGLGDTLTGNGSANRIDGGNGGDTVAGLGGDDLLIGGTGPDSVDGGAGNDTVAGGIGNDTLVGGADIDTADYSGLNGAVTVNLSTTTGQTTGLGTDTISGFENILGGIGNDKFTGTTGANRMEGASGSDQLTGLGGADVLLGGAGNDNLQGGAGDDTIEGGAGRDILVGGGDNDTFVFRAASESAVGGQRDRINSFVQGEDKVDIDPIDAMGGGADDDFAFIGNGGFSGSGTQGELRYFQVVSSSQTIVEGDIDGNGTADFQIAFAGLYNFNAGDFLGAA